MSMTATVSRLTAFRYWRGNEEATTDDWLNELNAPPNHRMDVGAAFQTVLENLSVGGEFANCEADGISFNFKCDAAIPQLNPVYGRKDYGQVLVSGKAGIVDGKRIEVFKTTKRFEAEKRQDDYQWRLYLDLFDADEFVWNIFVIAPNNPDETSYDVVDYHRLTATRYPGLQADCVSLINDFHSIMSSIPEEDMFMASTGRGRAKALPREVEMLTIHGDIVQETEDAILVDCGADKPVWLAKSQIAYTGARDDLDVEIRLPDWMAEEKGVKDGQRKTRPTVDGVADAATTPPDTPADGQVDAQATLPAEPAPACRFKGDVSSLGDGSIVLTVTGPKDKEKAFTFSKDALRFEGDDVADLQVGYKGIDFVIGWDIAVESGLAKHLKLKAPTSTPDAAQPESQTAATPAPEADEDAPKQEAKPYKSKLRTETVRATVELTPEEKNECAKRITDALSRRTDLKEKASYYSSKAREAEKEAYKASEVFESGEEERDITCDVIGDFNTMELVYVESEWPHREIQRRPMTDKDRQLLLPIEPPKEAEPEAAAAQPAEPEVAEAPDTEPEQPETVILYGALIDENLDGVQFTVQYGDEDNTEVEFFIPREQVITLTSENEFENQYQLTISQAYAIEAGIIDAPEEDAPAADGEGMQPMDFDALSEIAQAEGDAFTVDAGTEQEKACASCSHLDADDDEVNACEGCDDDLSNFASLDQPMHQEQAASVGGVQ